MYNSIDELNNEISNFEKNMKGTNNLIEISKDIYSQEELNSNRITKLVSDLEGLTNKLNDSISIQKENIDLQFANLKSDNIGLYDKFKNEVNDDISNLSNELLINYKDLTEDISKFENEFHVSNRELNEKVIKKTNEKISLMSDEVITAINEVKVNQDFLQENLNKVNRNNKLISIILVILLFSQLIVYYLLLR